MQSYSVPFRLRRLTGRWQIGLQRSRKASAHRVSNPRLLTSMNNSHQIIGIDAVVKREVVHDEVGDGVNVVGDLET